MPSESDYVEAGLFFVRLAVVLGLVLFVLFPIRGLIHLNFDLLVAIPFVSFPGILLLGVGGAKFGCDASENEDDAFERFLMYAFVAFLVFAFLSLLHPWMWF